MPPVNRETSLYLDLLRFLAAFTVFIGHVSGSRFTGGLFWQVSPFMAEAVTLFFVLSGFVIACATDRGETTATSYAVARAARILSVALPALVMTFALDALGRAVRPDLYSAAWGYVPTGQVWQFLAGLLFVNQIWFIDLPPGSDLPYWSLGFEVWYYVLFGIALFAAPRWRALAMAATLAAVGPRIAAMFPLWLLGWATWRLARRWTPGRAVGALLSGGSLALWLAYELWAPAHGRLQGLVPAWLNRPELAQDYLIGTLYAAHLLGVRAISPLLGRLLVPAARPIRWAAGATFTLYLFHLPLAQCLAALLPWPPASWAARSSILGGTLALVFLIASVTERRKDIWRRGLTLLLRPATLQEL